MRFTAIENFYSEETRSQYVAGLSYIITTAAHDDKLAELVPKWIAQGLVREGGPEAKMSGSE
jgi:hypothetical protein